jgi:hypothetical protein
MKVTCDEARESNVMIDDGSILISQSDLFVIQGFAVQPSHHLFTHVNENLFFVDFFI